MQCRFTTQSFCSLELRFADPSILQGQTPCQRCGNLHLECVYAPNCCNGFKDSHEYREMSAHIATLCAIARTIVEGHGGAIAVTDRDDRRRGARFIIRLPAAER